MWYQQSTGVQRDSLAQRAWYQGYQGYRGVPTHRVSGTKDSTCGTSRVLGCRETHWHRERGTRGTKGTEGYQHIESVVPKTQHVVPAEYWGAERLTGTESVVPGVPTDRVSGTKDSTCGTSRVLGCRETHWHRELGTRGTKGTNT